MIVLGSSRRAAVGSLALSLLLATSFPILAASTPLARLAPQAPVPAPALELKDTTGKLHRLADYRGKVVLINFWATWCEPCRDEMPSMQKLKQRTDKMAGAPLIILAVNHGESAARVESFLKTVTLGFPVLLDPFSEVSRAWKPGVLPASFLIGRDGRVHYRVIGEVDWSDVSTAAVIDRLLQLKG